MSDIGEVTQRLEELHDAGVAANEMGELFLTDYAMETIAMAKAKIESLEIFRRDAKVENAELHSQIESLQRENDELREHVKEAEAGAGEANELVKIIGRRQFITPEMRERLLRSLRWKNADKPSWGEAVYMRDSINMVLNTGGEG